MKLKEIEITLEERIVISLKYPFTKTIFFLNNFSYGCFFILQNNLPKFFYCAFDSEGVDKLDEKALLEFNGSYETYLVNRIQNQGYTQVSVPKGIYCITLRSEVKKFTVLEVNFE